ncbi:hypothetical protein M0638_24860 [Roseomonas sp. NAR14]|uniref:Uncharacterized protein n=1 Tax=Roseomonas acroporae TaxID=2937791 RepID=A0A9X2BWE6_9PROT|nr:hypothetical protein [Roseomonas acroporae]MCK8787602.1 hypothetical protein [Roseomonas acroporae]
MTRIPGLLLALACALPPRPVAAQANGNTWDWRHHQPDAGVAARERDAGVAPAPQVDRRLDQEVERLARQLGTPQPAPAAPGTTSPPGPRR